MALSENSRTAPSIASITWYVAGLYLVRPKFVGHVALCLRRLRAGPTMRSFVNKETTTGWTSR